MATVEPEAAEPVAQQDPLEAGWDELAPYEGWKPPTETVLGRAGIEVGGAVRGAGRAVVQAAAELPKGLTTLGLHIRRGLGDEGAKDIHPEDLRMVRVMEEAQNWAERAMPRDVRSVVGEPVGGALGSAGVFVGGGVVGRVAKIPAMLSAAGLGFLANGTGDYYNVLYGGGTEEDAAVAGLVGGGMGMTEALALAPIFGRLGLFKQLGPFVTPRGGVLGAVQTGMGEAAQEAAQQMTSNVLLDQLTPQEVSLFRDVGMSSGAGGAAGFILDIAVQGAQRMLGRPAGAPGQMANAGTPMETAPAPVLGAETAPQIPIPSEAQAGQQALLPGPQVEVPTAVAPVQAPVEGRVRGRAVAGPESYPAVDRTLQGMGMAYTPAAAPQRARGTDEFQHARGINTAWVDSDAEFDAIVDPETGTVVYNTKGNPAEQLVFTTFHEVGHVVREANFASWESFRDAIIANDLEGWHASQAAVAETPLFKRQIADMRAQGASAQQVLDFIEDETGSHYIEAIGNYTYAALTDGVRIREMANQNRGMLLKIMDAFAGVAQRLGLDVELPSVKRWAKWHDELAALPREKRLPPAKAARMGLEAKKMLNSILAIQEASEAAPAQPTEQAMAAAPEVEQVAQAPPAERRAGERRQARGEPEIPDIPQLELHDIANAAAQEEGLSVVGLPKVAPGRRSLQVTFQDKKGLSFPGKLSAEQILKAMGGQRGATRFSPAKDTYAGEDVVAQQVAAQREEYRRVAGRRTADVGPPAGVAERRGGERRRPVAEMAFDEAAVAGAQADLTARERRQAARAKIAETVVFEPEAAASEEQRGAARFKPTPEGHADFAAFMHGEGEQAAFDQPAESTLAAAGRWVFDRMSPVQARVEAVERGGGTITDMNDVYLRDTLWRGQATERVTKIKTRYLDPLRKAQKRGKLSGEDVGAFLQARHAVERNAQVRKLYQEGQGPGNPSGWSDADAQAEMAKWAENEEMQRIGRIWDRMNRHKLRGMVADGLITQEFADTLQSTYRHWAPLKTLSEDEHAYMGMGRGHEIKSHGLKRAFGRSTRADNPLVSGFTSAVMAAVRGEKAGVGRSFLENVEQNPDPDFATINLPTYKMVVDKKTGFARKVYDVQALQDPNVFVVMRAGAPVYVRVNERHQKLVDALRGDNLRTGGAVGEFFGAAGRQYVGLLTRYNPGFIPFNLLRDFLQAMVYGLGEKGVWLKPWDLPAAYRALATGKGRLGEYAREYRETGAPITFLDLENFETLGKRVAESAAGDKPLKEKLQGVFEVVGQANDIVENGTRFLAYVALRERGYSADRAGFYAKELLNFERKGEIGPALSAHTLLANASLQGLRRSGQALANPKVQALMAGAIGAHALIAALSRALAGDDEDGINRYDKLPEWEKRSNLILFYGSGEGDKIEIPLPPIYRVFAYIGTNIEAVTAGSKKPWTAAADTAEAAWDDVNFLGSNLVQMVSPWFLDPVTDAITNKDWKGAPINPTKFDRTLPDSESFFKSSPEWAKVAARTLNRLTGGTAAESGLLDFAPGTLEHIGQFLTPGVISEGRRIVEGVSSGDLERRHVPIVRRIWKGPNPMDDLRIFHRHAEQIESVPKRAKANKAGGLPAPEDSELNSTGWRRRADQVRERVNALYDKMREAKSPAERDTIEREILKLVRDFNGDVRQRLGRGEPLR